MINQKGLSVSNIFWPHILGIKISTDIHTKLKVRKKNIRDQKYRRQTTILKIWLTERQTFKTPVQRVGLFLIIPYLSQVYVIMELKMYSKLFKYFTQVETTHIINWWVWWGYLG